MKQSIKNLVEYIERDNIYQLYLENNLEDASDFDMFCVKHCKDIDEALQLIKLLINLYREKESEIKTLTEALVIIKKYSISQISLKDRFRTSVKHYRLTNKLSQKQLAEKVDLTVKYISDIERGKFTPSLDVIETIASVFKVDPLDLLTDKYYEECVNNKIKIDQIRGRIRKNKKKLNEK